MVSVVYQRTDSNPYRWAILLPTGQVNEPVFPTMPNKTAKMFRANLATAGITYRDNSGRVADLRSLRHTFISIPLPGHVHALS